MIPVVFKPVTKILKLTLDSHPVKLSPSFQSKVENFWNNFNNDNRFTLGEIFHVAAVEETAECVNLNLKTTDYAHYLFSVKQANVGEEGCKVIYGAGLIETADSYFVFGEMSDKTAYPGRLQCVGGGLSRQDLHNDEFQLKDSVLREMTEELGIKEQAVKNCSVQFIKTGGDFDFIAILFHIQLKMTLRELHDTYNDLCLILSAKGESPEFASIISIKNESTEVEDFIKNNTSETVDYLIPYLKKMSSVHSM